MQADSSAERRDLEGTQRPRGSAPGGLREATPGWRLGWRGVAGCRREEARHAPEKASPRPLRTSLRQGAAGPRGRWRVRLGGLWSGAEGAGDGRSRSPGRGGVCAAWAARGGVCWCAHAARAGRVPLPLTKPQWSFGGGRRAPSHARSAEPRSSRTAEPSPSTTAALLAAHPRGPRGTEGTELPLGKFWPQPARLSGSVSKPLD